MTHAERQLSIDFTTLTFELLTFDFDMGLPVVRLMENLSIVL